MSRLNEKNKREREKAEELRKKNYKIPEWTSSRPKPFFDPTIWPDQETTDKMAVYTDWHGRHPHMVTPRPLEDVLVLTGKNIQVASPRTQAMTYTSEEDKEAIADTGMPKTKGEQLVSYGNGLHAPLCLLNLLLPKWGPEANLPKLPKCRTNSKESPYY